MIRNMGTADRVIRFLVAVLIAVLYFSDQISGTAAIILAIIALAFFATSFVGVCPVYSALKVKTIKKSA